jgi:sterol desaturase/sphingolipid hydroxylase (fatty acid hydroxylase superfamily)
LSILALVLLVCLQAARLVFLWQFGSLSSLLSEAGQHSFYIGLKFDLRLIALMLMPAWLLLRPGTDPARGRWQGALVLALALVVYVCVVVIGSVDDRGGRPWLLGFLLLTLAYHTRCRGHGLSSGREVRWIWGVYSLFVVGFVLLATNLLVHKLFGWAAKDGIRFWVQDLPLPIALFLIVLVADLVQYALHRAYHRVPALWRLHAVHHSVKTMDWMAGSRQHLLEVLITRALVLGPILALGFAKEVIDAYIVIVGFHAVFNHANVDVRLGPLRHLIVTPNFHHWHHAQDGEAIDRKFAAHFAFIDHLFGTAVRSDRPWPAMYGVVGDHVPQGFWRQTLYPLIRRRAARRR